MGGRYPPVKDVPALTDVEGIGRILFESGEVGIVTVGLDGGVIRANPVTLKILGSPSEEVTRMFNLFELPTLPVRIRNLVKQSVVSGESLDISVDYTSMHGRKSQFRLKSLPVRSEGELVGAVCQLMDISELRAAEERVRRTSKMESLVLMASALAHDLNNVFTTLVGYASMLSQGGLDDRRRAQALTMITKAAESGARLVDQLHSFTSERRAQTTACLFDAAFEQAIGLFRYGLPEGIELQTQNLGEAVRVRGSIPKIEQVLLNLALNARDAVEEKGGGRVLLQARRVDVPPHSVLIANTPATEGYVRVRVEDNGVGIAADSLQKVFDPFFTTKAPGKGTGMGLSSVWGILKELGGTLRVESTPNVGTVFDVFFPISSRSVPVESTELPVAASLLGEGQRILVVEPDTALRDLLVLVLLRNGYKALAADGPGQALELLHTSPLELNGGIIECGDNASDWKPLMQAWEKAALPAVCLVGRSQDRASGSRMASLGKPFTPQQLLEQLAMLFVQMGSVGR